MPYIDLARQPGGGQLLEDVFPVIALKAAQLVSFQFTGSACSEQENAQAPDRPVRLRQARIEFRGRGPAV